MPKEGAGASAGKEKKQSNLLYHGLNGLLIAFVFALAAWRYFIVERGDRHHCHALMNEGRWLDSRHTKWQPEGCMLHPYKPKEVAECFQDKQVVFIGDSTTRLLFYAFVKYADKTVDSKGVEKHSDRSVIVGSTTYSFYWDPYLNSTSYGMLMDGSLTRGTPGLAVIGTGLWFLRHPSTGGVPEYKRRIDDITRVTARSSKSVAEEVMMLPVEHVFESMLSPDRGATIHLEDIQTMNAYLEETINEHSLDPVLAVPNVLNRMIEGLDAETQDGLHFSNAISAVQAHVLLNARCNDAVTKKFPFDKTCCSRYPFPNWAQIALLALLTLWGPIGMSLAKNPSADPRLLSFFPDAKYQLPLTIFGFACTMMFVTDRTGLFLKENKGFEPITFWLLWLITFGAGALTMKPAEKDLGFLNREQTDEWKGWMQILILVYHWYGASKIDHIYQPMRPLVASYLFMTGYGHFSFFVGKADFSFLRVAQILTRLNLLTVVLAYLLDTDYLSYYFSPLVTMWFVIIWVTLFVGHQYNGNGKFVAAKMAIAAALFGAFIRIEGPLEATFRFTDAVFGTAWNAKEWRFRVALDLWIVWVGAYVALINMKVKEHKLMDRPQWAEWKRMVTYGLVALYAIYFVFQWTRENKFVYNTYHPVISIIPVLLFVVLRNSTVYLRSTSSRFFIWIGQCSLETFLIQFHMFISGDTQGILMMIPGGAWMRQVNFIVVSAVFLYVSEQVAKATGLLTAWICQVPKSSGASKPSAGAVGGGGAAYVPLSSTTGSTVEEKEGAISTGPSSASPSLLAKVGAFARTDLRLRFAIIFVALVVLNLVYPSDSKGEHLLPTH